MRLAALHVIAQGGGHSLASKAGLAVLDADPNFFGSAYSVVKGYSIISFCCSWRTSNPQE